MSVKPKLLGQQVFLKPLVSFSTTCWTRFLGLSDVLVSEAYWLHDFCFSKGLSALFEGLAGSESDINVVSRQLRLGARRPAQFNEGV